MPTTLPVAARPTTSACANSPAASLETCATPCAPSRCCAAVRPIGNRPRRGARPDAGRLGSGVLHGRRQQAGALVPLELALHQLQADQRGGAQLLGLLLQLVQGLVVGAVVDALDAGVDDAELDLAGGPLWQGADTHGSAPSCPCRRRRGPRA